MPVRRGRTATVRDIAKVNSPNLLRFARGGDTMVVHRMDRLAPNPDEPVCLGPGFTRKGVRVKVVNESLVFRETDSPIANLMLSAMAAFTEFERDRSGSPP
jgi:DNA invertase Pin-like site-specific DNA recombinase